ncbi:MAG: hypothetical protein V1874_02830 [Spirochaetota bacterium]
MKQKEKIIFIIFFFLTSLFTATASHAKKSILDYYNSIPLNQLNNFRYKLQQKNNKWITRSNVGYDFEVIVDIKNGYLNIMDSGTGGGTGTQEVALYSTNAGSDIVGVNLITFDGIDSACTLKFFKPDDKWKDVTDDILPKIDLFLFMDGSYKVNHQRKMDSFLEFTKGITLLYQLPRVGTTMSVKVDLDRFIMENRQKGTGHNLKSNAYEIIKSIKYREIKLTWDSKSNKFNTGGTALFVPTSDLEKQYIHIPHKENIDSNQPAKNDPERKAILDTLRKRWPDSSVVFVVKYLKVAKGWAWIHVAPQSRDGQSHGEDESWLLQKVSGQWKTVEARGAGLECEEDPDCSDSKRFFKKCKLKYPSVPESIFSY